MWQHPAKSKYRVTLPFSSQHRDPGGALVEGGSKQDVSCEATSQGQLPSPWPLGTTHCPPAPVPALRTGPQLCPASGPRTERRGRGEKIPQRRLGRTELPLHPQLPPAAWFLGGLGSREEAPRPSHPPRDPPTVLRDERPRRGPLPDTRTSNRKRETCPPKKTQKETKKGSRRS